MKKTNLKKRVLKHILSLFVACLCSYGVSSQELNADKETLSVLSYNIHMWESSVETLTGVIKAANPDIVGLNEAWNEKKNGEIAKALGYNIVCGGQGVPGSGTKRSHCVNDYYMPK
jgi:endonuclease/exonuclease/phosphatase (EEP) superfamily protein YafD